MNQASNKGGYVRRFSRYNDAQMQKLKETLRMQMSSEQLGLCAAYFESVEGRDPSVEELMMLDLLAQIPGGIAEITLSELYTNDPNCADTYADMMSKRRELLSDTETPISVGEAMELASAYLERIGKPAQIDGKCVTLGDACPLTENIVGISDASVSVIARDAANAPIIREGNVFMLFHRGSMPFWKYDSLIEPLLSSQEVCESAKFMFTVPKEGLLPMLSRCFDGICYDLRALSPNGSSETVRQLLGKFSGYRVVVLSRENAERVASLARRMEFRPIIFAAAPQEMRTTFLYSDKKFSFETKLLRALRAKQSAIAKLPDETKDFLGEITHTPFGLYSSRYLDMPSVNQRIKTQNGVSVASACGKLNASPYRTALKTALTAILSNAVAGCSETDSRIAFSLRCPSCDNDEMRIGQILSAILGVYRLQCELAIPAAASEIVTNDSVSEPELCVFSISPSQTLPSEFVRSGASLYCVAPIVNEDGLPDFDALRKMIRELASFCSQGYVESVRVLCNERITDAVQLMETDKLTCRLTDGAALSGAELPLAILLETSAKLPYKVIGQVTDRAVTEVPSSSVQIPAFESTLNRGDSYEILILSKQNDVDAINLSRILNSRGARCANLFDTTPDGIVARAIMRAQLVILCGEYPTCVDEQISFAVRVLHEAGGSILRVGNQRKLSCDIADFVLPRGISEDILSQIAAQSERIKSFS